MTRGAPASPAAVAPGETIQPHQHLVADEIVFVFSKPGFEQLMRENSVLEGETATPLSPDEAREIRARHRWHTTNDQP